MLWTSWSEEMVRKSMYMISAIGRMPRMAAPAAAPAIAASEIAVSITRCRAELVVEAAGRRIRAAVEPDVLAHDEHGLVALHLLALGVDDRLAVGHDRHPELLFELGRRFLVQLRQSRLRHDVRLLAEGSPNLGLDRVDLLRDRLLLSLLRLPGLLVDRHVDVVVQLAHVGIRAVDRELGGVLDAS